VTGPTGSGKTTTLYSALNFVNERDKNIITIEDPVEYQLKRINQVQAKAEIGLTFSAGLRSVLRQDPDIIMVGEIRDLETAEIALRSALTGHLVLSTIHTNSSIATIMRLIDMGIDRYLICSAIHMVLAQRLVRRTCFHCSEPYEIEKAFLNKFRNPELFEDGFFMKGKGCNHCGGTGYWGRLAVFEFLPISQELRSLIMNEHSLDDILSRAKEMGMETLLENGIRKAKMGVTTLEEVLRVTSDTL
jgi:type II secretory ATPase GspE/PulE/Tfp pilus assembly ATPase PilB-like protein